MKKIKMYQVDAFADRLFSGNPAAVCILDKWLSDDLMQSIAFENNLAETAFVIPDGRDFKIRWFTPAVEVDLCGHATLASAFVIFNVLDYPDNMIRFQSQKSGVLSVEKKDDLLILNFPTDKLEFSTKEESQVVENCIGARVAELVKGRSDYLALLENEETVKKIEPDFVKMLKLAARGLIVTAKGDNVDFVSRFFAPQCGINEDPVTGSAHISLTPFWSAKLGKNKMTAHQLSKRGGQLMCELKNDRCLIGGKARLYLSGEIYPE
jgi:PhzF family phenazine biosynthesis protein